MATYEEIYHNFTKGDITPFYRTMYPELLLYAIGLLGEEFAFLAEDCVQDAIFNTYLQKNSFKTIGQWKVFLYTCVRNGAISVLRKGRAGHNYMALQEKVDENLMLDILEQETLTLLYQAIEALPEKYKELLELSFEEGLKNAEVAERLHISESSVKKQKSRIISLLRKNLGDKLNEPDLLTVLHIIQTILLP